MFEFLVVGLLLAFVVVGTYILGAALIALAQAIWQDIRHWGSRT